MTHFLRLIIYEAATVSDAGKLESSSKYSHVSSFPVKVPPAAAAPPAAPAPGAAALPAACHDVRDAGCCAAPLRRSAPRDVRLIHQTERGGSK